METKCISLLRKKTIFITGGTGSFGNFFVREILKYKPKRIIIFSRDEDKQYTMQQELKEEKGRLRFIIGDVRDREQVFKSMQGSVDILVHAAALKQIPSTEYNLLEAVKTNVLGSQNVVDAALASGVKKALSVSTDKAVEPINVYGMTKALQERIFIIANKYRNGGSTIFANVRYGNVMGSRGSVLLVFKKQMETGGPFTITHKEMTRFTISLGEAINLTLNALSDAKGGEIFIPKLKSLRIIDLAEVMVENLRPKDKRIIEIGIRPGEKLHESLISQMESLRTLEKKDYFLILPEIADLQLGHNFQFSPRKNERLYRYSSDNQKLLTKKEIKQILAREKVI